MAATSRAGIADLGITTNSFQNYKGSIRELNSKGIVDNQGATFQIKEVDSYIDNVKNIYGNGNLNPYTEKLIRDHISSKESFPNPAGLPGLHAEVRSANDIFNQLSAKGIDPASFDLTKIQISTFKVANANGKAFPACSNCKGIIPIKAKILTRRK